MCTRALYVGGDGLVITGRGMDWGEDMRSNMWVFPRGMARDGSVRPTPCADLAHRVHLARPRSDASISDLVVSTPSEPGFGIRSVLNSFGGVTVQICTCPLAEVPSRRQVVRGIQQGLIQEVIDLNVEAIGGHYSVAVRPDPHRSSCEVSLILRPGTGRPGRSTAS